MPSLAYLSRAPDGNDMNRLLAEFDRRLTVAFSGGCSPLVPTQGLGTHNDLWVNEVSGGIPNLLGTPFKFTGGGTLAYWYGAEVDDYDHAALQAIAAAATEVSRDETKHVSYVTADGDTAQLEGSLEAHRINDGGQDYWLAVGTEGSVRALRRHEYAVAELICEGLGALTVPAEWDRYECFRVHNLSGGNLTVTVETHAGDEEIVVRPYGVRAFRRGPDYFDASWNYFWKFRAQRDRPRFLLGGGVPAEHAGIGVPEASQRANPLAQPNVILRWFAAFSLKLDPRELPDLSAQYPMFHPPATADRFGDLLHHQGEVRVITYPVDTAEPPIITVGRFNGYATLVADFDALGITATESGGVWTLTPKTGHAGDAAKGMSLFTPGSNLLSKPGDDGHRLFRELAGGFALEAAGSIGHTQQVFTVDPGTSVVIEDEVLTGFVDEVPQYTTVSASIPTYTVNLIDPPITLAQDDPPTPPASVAYQTVGSFKLTPGGWRALYSYEFSPGERVHDGGPNWPLDGVSGGGLLAGLYDDITAAGTYQHRGVVWVRSRGWPLDDGTGNPYFLPPNAPRKYATRGYDATLGFLAPGFTDHLAGLDGAGLATTARTPVLADELRVLTPLATTAYVDDPFEQYGGLHWNAGLVTAWNHQVFALPDNGRVPTAVAALPCDNLSSIYAQRTLLKDGDGEVDASQWHDHLVLPQLAAHWNLLAWHVNAWTRSVPLVHYANVLVNGGVTINGITEGDPGALGPVLPLGFVLVVDPQTPLVGGLGQGPQGYPDPAWMIAGSNLWDEYGWVAADVLTWLGNVGIAVKDESDYETLLNGVADALDEDLNPPQTSTIVFQLIPNVATGTVTYASTSGGEDHYVCAAEIDVIASSVAPGITIPWYQNVGEGGTAFFPWERLVDPPPTYADVNYIAFQPELNLTPSPNGQAGYFAAAAAGLDPFYWVEAGTVAGWADGRGLVFAYVQTGVPLALHIENAEAPAVLLDLAATGPLQNLLQEVDPTDGPSTHLSVPTGDPAPAFSAPNNYALVTWTTPAKFVRFRPLESGEAGDAAFVGELVTADAISLPQADNEATGSGYVWRKPGIPVAGVERSSSVFGFAGSGAVVNDGRSDTIQSIDAKRLRTQALLTLVGDPTEKLQVDTRLVGEPWGHMALTDGWVLASSANWSLGLNGTPRDAAVSDGVRVLLPAPGEVAVLDPGAGTSGAWKVWLRHRLWFDLG